MATLNAEVREITGRDNKQLRRQAKIPAVVYGRSSEPRNVILDVVEFQKVLDQAGESSLVDLKISGAEDAKILIQDVHYHPIKGLPIHADLYEVDMGKELSTSVELEFTGEALAVKNLGGTLVTSQDEVEIRALPGDLVSSIRVPLDGLKTFEESIYVRDIQVPKGITITTPQDLLVAKVAAPRVDEEESVISEEEAVEGVEKAGEEGEEGEAGEEAAPEGDAKEGGDEKKGE